MSVCADFCQRIHRKRSETSVLNFGPFLNGLFVTEFN